MTDTFSRIGYYCGRLGEGLTAEPQNALTNVAFLIAAGYGLVLWRATTRRDGYQLALIGLAAMIGLGSFLFHTMHVPITLWLDLIPIQLFGLAALFYLARGAFGLSVSGALGVIAVFFLLRQGWIISAPRGALGGGITHVPTIALLIASGILLVRRGERLGRYLLAAAGLYVAAIGARVADIMLCSALPFGFHWLWHLLTAAVIALILIGLIGSDGTAKPKNHAPMPSP
jgi:hypothetical protein